jgi:hypothetical protein
MTDDRVFAKCAWRLIPFMALLYLVSFIDRANEALADHVIGVAMKDYRSASFQNDPGSRRAIPGRVFAFTKCGWGAARRRNPHSPENLRNRHVTAGAAEELIGQERSDSENEDPDHDVLHPAAGVFRHSGWILNRLIVVADHVAHRNSSK